MNNLLAIFLITLNVINAFELDVYRMVGIEQDQFWSGSKIASFQMLTTHWSEVSLRKVALIKFSEINANSMSELLTNKPNGVLIILDQISGDNEYQIWDLITTNLGPKGATIPIYFTYESENIKNHYQEIQSETDQEYQLQVTSVDQKQILTLEDSYNLIESISNFKQNNPSTLIVLGIDENLPSAEITIPIERFGIQSSIFFKIAREFKYQQRLSRNIIFYISTSQSLNEYGLKQFYKKQEYQRILSTIDTIIIFDQINQDEQLHIEVNSALLAQIQTNLTQINVALKEIETTTIQNKEIDTIRIYTQKQLKILTQQQNFTKVQDNEQIVMNLVSQLIDGKPYEQQHQDLLFDQALNQFINTPNRHPTNLQKDSKFMNDFNSLLRQLFKHTTKMQYVVKDRKFFTSSQLKGQIIKFYSAFIDLYLILGVGTWLVFIYAITKYVPIFRIEQNANKKRK
ncbi:unnamed protein product [Paramecium sonneborni]|uniref:Uncharacterized protein n=1 Tax=Paramecium sonneborni TaxID=65129 RepID=A0A8S1LHF0_9CILI|nr:unnamed protein product [Paramecium sonneborni]